MNPTGRKRQTDGAYPVTMTGPNSFKLFGQEYSGKPVLGGQPLEEGERAFVCFAGEGGRFRQPVIVGASTRQSPMYNTPGSVAMVLGGWQHFAANYSLNNFAGHLDRRLRSWSDDPPAPAETLRTPWGVTSNLVLAETAIHSIRRSGGVFTWYALNLSTGADIASQGVTFTGSPLDPYKTVLDYGSGLSTTVMQTTDSSQRGFWVWGVIDGSHELVRSATLQTNPSGQSFSFAGPYCLERYDKLTLAVSQSPEYEAVDVPSIEDFLAGDTRTQLDVTGGNAIDWHLLNRTTGEWSAQSAKTIDSINSGQHALPLGEVPFVEEGDNKYWLAAICAVDKLAKDNTNFGLVYGLNGPDFTASPLPNFFYARWAFTRRAVLSLQKVPLAGNCTQLEEFVVTPTPTDSAGVATVLASFAATYPQTVNEVVDPPFEFNRFHDTWGGSLAENELDCCRNATVSGTPGQLGGWPVFQYFESGYVALPGLRYEPSLGAIAYEGERNSVASPTWTPSDQIGGLGISYEGYYYGEFLKPVTVLMPGDEIAASSAYTGDTEEVVENPPDSGIFEVYLYHNYDRIWKLIREPETWRENIIVLRRPDGVAELECSELVTYRRYHAQTAQMLEFSARVPYQVHWAGSGSILSEGNPVERRYVRVRDSLQHSRRSSLSVTDTSNDYRGPVPVVEIRDGQDLALQQTIDVLDHSLLSTDILGSGGTAIAFAGQDFAYSHSVPQIRLQSYDGRLYLALQWSSHKLEDWRTISGLQVAEITDWYQLYDITDGSVLDLVHTESYTNPDGQVAKMRAFSDIPILRNTAWSSEPGSWIYYALELFAGTELRRQQGET